MSSECDFAAIHNLLAHAVRRRVPFPTEDIIIIADRLHNRISVEQLKSCSSCELRGMISSNR